MKSLRLLIGLLFLSMGAFAQTTPWSSSPPVIPQTRTFSGQKQLRFIWGSNNIYSLSDSTDIYVDGTLKGLGSTLYPLGTNTDTLRKGAFVTRNSLGNLGNDTTNYSPLFSPHFIGVPTVPTASPGTNTTQAASTAFVAAAVGGGSTNIGNSDLILTGVRLLNTANNAFRIQNGTIVGSTVQNTGLLLGGNTAILQGKQITSGPQSFTYQVNLGGGSSTLSLADSVANASSSITITEVGTSTTHGVKVTDNIYKRGLIAAANYDANLIPASYITKRAADSLYASSGGSGHTLTLGYGLLGGSYNGSSAVTTLVDSTVFTTLNLLSTYLPKAISDTTYLGHQLTADFDVFNNGFYFKIDSARFGRSSQYASINNGNFNANSSTNFGSLYSQGIQFTNSAADSLFHIDINTSTIGISGILPVYFNQDVHTKTLYSQSLNINGTSGAGYINLAMQAADPAFPGTGTANIYIDPSGWLTLRGGGAGWGYSFSDALLTGYYTYALPNADGTLALTSALPSGANPTASIGFTAVNGSATSFTRSDGAAKADSAIIASTANHPTLAQQQTKFNNETLQVVATRGNSFSGQIQAQTFAANGTGGNGMIDILSQSVSPTSTTGHLKIYSDSLNRFSYKNSTYRRTFQIPYPSDYTARFPYLVTGTTLEDSTHSVAVYSTTASNGVIKTGINFTSDTTYNRAVANSYSLSALQTKFNLYQKTVSLTTTGANGASTFNSSTGALNIPTYTLVGLLPSLTTGSVLYYNGTTIAQDNANFFWDGTNHWLGLATAVPTNSLTFSSTSTGYKHFLTSDQVTNTQSISGTASGGTYTLLATNTGSAAAPTFNITNTNGTLNLSGGGTTLALGGTTSTTAGFGNLTRSSSAAVPLFSLTGTTTASSSIADGFVVNRTYNQTSTAGGTDIKVLRTETGLGSGQQNFLDFQVGGSSKFRIDHNNLFYFGGSAGTANQVPIVNTAGTAMTFASVPIMQASADLAAQTAAGNVTTFTVGASTATFNISGYINITAVTIDVIELQVTYTDENSTSQTANFFTQGATSALLSAIGNSVYPPMTIRAKNGTVIIVKTTLTTGTGSITYDAGARIQQL